MAEHDGLLLDRYLDDLVTDPRSPVPAALDGEVASFARAVVAAERAAVTEPTAAIKARIWRRAVMNAERSRTSQPRGTSVARWVAGIVEGMRGAPGDEGVQSGPRSLPRRLRVGLASVIVLLGVVFGGVVLAQTLPRSIRPVVPPTPPAYEGPLPAPPSAPRSMEIADLQRLLGAQLLLPTTLPPGCAAVERFYFDLARVVYLRYSCVLISEELAVNGAEPHAPADALQWITVGGRPALYVDGIWANTVRNGQRPPQPSEWRYGTDQQVLFERDGLLIRVQSIGTAVSKDQLISIAESLK